MAEAQNMGLWRGESIYCFFMLIDCSIRTIGAIAHCLAAGKLSCMPCGKAGRQSLASALSVLIIDAYSSGVERNKRTRSNSQVLLMLAQNGRPGQCGESWIFGHKIAEAR